MDGEGPCTDEMDLVFRYGPICVNIYIYIFIAKFAKMALKMNLAATATRNVAARAENRPTW
jgi:hypothetical protein